MSQNTELKAQTKKPGLNKKGIAAWINNYSFILIALAIFIAYLFINHGATTWSGVMNILRHSWWPEACAACSTVCSSAW